MFKRHPRTSAARFLLDLSQKPRSLETARKLADELNAPQPTGDERAYSKTLIDWEKHLTTAGLPIAFVSVPSPNGAGAIVSCRSCLRTTHFISLPQEQALPRFSDKHQCN